MRRLLSLASAVALVACAEAQPEPAEVAVAYAAGTTTRPLTVRARVDGAEVGATCHVTAASLDLAFVTPARFEVPRAEDGAAVVTTLSCESQGLTLTTDGVPDPETDSVRFEFHPPLGAKIWFLRRDESVTSYVNDAGRLVDVP